jgi:hypothetical protein
MYLNKTYFKVHIHKHLSDTFPTQNGLKSGDALSPFLFNFPLEYATRKIQVNKKDLNGTHQFLVYTDDVDLWGKVKENHRSCIKCMQVRKLV